MRMALFATSRGSAGCDERGPYRLEEGGVLLDRNKPKAFFINGVSQLGFEGDTLASALLALGLDSAPRSPRYSRPRALASSGAEEPSALFRIEDRRGAEPGRASPLVPLRAGLKAVAPGVRDGSKRRWFGSLIDVISGARAEPRRSVREILADGAEEELNFFTDVLVIGGGVAGLAAAKAAAACGARVLLAEQAAHWGGSSLAANGKIGRSSVKSWIYQEIAKLEDCRDATLRNSLEALTLNADDGALLLERPAAPGPLRRMWRVRARRVILASGAAERGLLFAENDLPGVMSASAMRQYLKLQGVVAGRRIAVFTTNDSGYRAAIDLAEAGAEIAAIVDPREKAQGPDPRRARELGLPLRLGATVLRAIAEQGGAGRVEAIEVGSLRGSGRVGRCEMIACDALGVSGGWCPETRLYTQAGGARIWDQRLQQARPDKEAEALSLPCGAALCVAGAANGAQSLDECIAQGLEAGKQAAKALGFKVKRLAPPKLSEAEGAKDAALAKFYLSPGRDPLGDAERIFVDPASDLTLAEVERAARAKASTVDGMRAAVGLSDPLCAPSETLAALTIAEMRDADPQEALGSQMGAAPCAPPRPALFKPCRETPLRSWHAAHGGVMRDLAGWRAPDAFLRQSGPDGEMEDQEEATIREVRLARRGVAAYDASALTKLRIEGSEAAEVLEILGCAEASAAPVGRCRVVMLSLSGGAALGEAVISRLEENAYLLHAAPEISEICKRALETAVQGRTAQWIDLTEAFAQITLIGPKSRMLLERLSETDLSAKALPASAWTMAQIAGRDLRIFRISRGGGLAFELETPAARAQTLLETIFGAGQLLGIQPLGAKAADILRIERGRPAVGREIDGEASAAQLRIHPPGEVDAAGHVLIGLISEDPGAPFPEGAEIHIGDGAADGFFKRRAAATESSIGRVTSSCWSPTLERAIALGMASGDAARPGAAIHVVDRAGRVLRGNISSPCFVDPAAQNIDGWRPL